MSQPVEQINRLLTARAAQGRLSGIIEKPQNAWLSNVVFAGPNLDTMYVTCTNKVFKRKTNVKGLRYFEIPSAAGG